MKLHVTTPTRVVFDREVDYVQAEDPTGRLGMLPRHERFLTALVPSILIARYTEGGKEREVFIAVRHGVLRVSEDSVRAAVRDAYMDDDLEALQAQIRAERQRLGVRSYRSKRSLYQMQLSAWRQLMEYEDVRSR